MNSLYAKLNARVRSLFRRRRIEAEMAEEMRAHLEMQAQANRAAGMEPAEARDAALRRFGGVEQIKEQCRDGFGWGWLDRIVGDLRHASRQLVRAPGFCLTVIITLALGIGASSAIFTVINSVLLRPITYHESERLMVLQETNLPQFATYSSVPANFRDWVQQAEAFESMYAVQGTAMNLVGEGEPIRVLTARVTGQCFTTLRVQPLLGRVFGPAEDAPGKNNVVVLTHAFWQRKFGGRPDIVGRTLQLQGAPYEVIGVMPPEFERGEHYEIYTPAAFPEQLWQNRSAHVLSFAFGRLKSGATVEQARAQLDAIAARLASQYPATNRGWGVVAVPLLDFHVATVRPTFYALFAAAGALLLIACVNIANLLLVRASVRQREISVRVALGASRLHVAAQLLAESLLLAVLGGVLGLVVARWGVSALLALAPADLPRANEIAVDGRAVAFTFAITLLTGIAFGLVPGWFSSRLNVLLGLRVSRRSMGDGPGARAFRQGLIITEIALTLVVLTVAGLLVRSFARLSHTSPGFQPEGAVMMWVMAPQYNNAEKQLAFAAAVMDRLRTLPEVTSVGATPFIPFSSNYWPRPVQIEGQTSAMAERPVSLYYAITPDYFRAMGIPLVQGRAFNEQDRAGGLRVAIVSQSFVARHFPGVDPIGKRFQLAGGPPEWREIVGVVGDIWHKDFDTEIIPQNYEPFAQNPMPVLTFVVRTSGDVGALPASLRRELNAVDATQPVFLLESLSRLVGAKMARQRIAMVLVGTISGVALLLAAVGVYGTMAYTVAQRTGEFGVRLALGARPADLQRLVLGRGARMIALGIVLGAGGAYAATGFIQSLLYRTPARDPLVFAGIAALLGVVALLACWLPARRAAKVDPMVALRAE